MAEHRDEILMSMHEWTPANFDGKNVALSIMVCSISPTDAEWFNENCPPEWKEHIALRRIDVQRFVPHQHLVEQPAVVLSYLKGTLIHKMCTELVENLPTEMHSG